MFKNQQSVTLHQKHSQKWCLSICIGKIITYMNNCVLYCITEVGFTDTMTRSCFTTSVTGSAECLQWYDVVSVTWVGAARLSPRLSYWHWLSTDDMQYAWVRSQLTTLTFSLHILLLCRVVKLSFGTTSSRFNYRKVDNAFVKKQLWFSNYYGW